MSDNTYIGTGLLTRFEEKDLGEGKRVCSFSILLPENPESEAAKKREGTFIPVESWNVSPQLAKLLASKVKGCRVFIKGRLKLDYWNDKASGASRTQLKVIADVVNYQPLPPKREGGGQWQNRGAQAGAPAATPAAAPASQPEAVAAGGQVAGDVQFDAQGNPIPF